MQQNQKIRNYLMISRISVYSDNMNLYYLIKMLRMFFGESSALILRN